ncbi:MAG: glycosyltransferase [Candidatus Competibacteraceae bacterium]|nr:glycosyltransferase [Candidatus Competibacteraceae bacterium]
MAIILMGAPETDLSGIVRILSDMLTSGGFTPATAKAPKLTSDNVSTPPELALLHRQMLARVGPVDRLTGFDISFLEADSRQFFQKRAQQILAGVDDQPNELLVDNELCFLLPLWLPLLEKPVCIVCVPHSPLDFAAAIQTTYACSLPVGVALWEFWTKRLLHLTCDLPRIIIASELLSRDPQAVAQALFTQLEAAGVVGLTPPDSFAEPITEVLQDQVVSDTAALEHYLNDIQRHHLHSLRNGTLGSETTAPVSNGAQEILELFKDYQAQAEQHSIQDNRLQLLIVWLERLQDNCLALFGTWSWKIGRSVIRAVLALMLRKPTPGVHDNIVAIFRDFRAWRQHELKRLLSCKPKSTTLEVKDKPAIALLVETRHDGKPSGSANIRLLRPLTHPSVSNAVAVQQCSLFELFNTQHNLIVVQRSAVPDKPSAEALLAHCRRWNIKLAVDIDDDLLHLPATVSQVEYWPERLEALELLLKGANGVIASSERLAENLRGLNQRVICIPNALDESLWLTEQNGCFERPRRIGDKTIRILYMGTATHGHDLKLLKPAYQRLQKEYGSRLALDMVGGIPPYARSFGRLLQPGEGLPEEDPYAGFVHWLRQTQQWDFGIIPLELTPFNRQKSFIKFLDYSALGLAAICSDIDPYQAVVRHGENGLLVGNDANSWYQAMRELINQQDLRERLAENAFQDLTDHYILHHRAQDYLAAYRSLLKA